MVAPGRLAVVRAALMTAVFAVLTVEGLGAIGRLSLVPVATAWLVFVVAALAAAALRHRRAPWRPRLRPRHWWREAGLAERLLAGTVGGLLLLELLVALLAEPNNFDSQTYHLPKVEHWVAQGSLELWPTAIHRQVTIPPGAEYLLLHLRLLTGGDGLYHLIQWGAGLGAVLLVSRITAQLGGGRRAQLLSAFVLACTPMVVLQATSTQTDLVVAAWVGVVATLVLDGLRRPANATMVLGLGAATGLTALTKTSGLLGVGPMLLFWGVVQLRTALAGDHRAVKAARVMGASVLVLAAAAVVTGPFMARMTVEFDHPLGPPRLRESIPMQRHDPASILVNGVRIAHTALDVPVPPLTAATAAGIVAFAEAIGVDPQDRAITFGKETFPVPAWYPDEDRAAFPITGTLALIALALALIRPARLITDDRRNELRGYALAVLASGILHIVMIKWQTWGNRLLLYALVLAVPLVGLWLDTLLRRRAASGRRPVATVVISAVLAVAAVAGLLSVVYGYPRRLVGAESVLTNDDWETRFIRRPQWADEYRWAADAVRDSGARRIGLVQLNDDWEYPWWLLLRDPDGGSPQIVSLRSTLPERPAADPATVDAIVCAGARRECERLTPAGWRLEHRDHVGYALPPG